MDAKWSEDKAETDDKFSPRSGESSPSREKDSVAAPGRRSRRPRATDECTADAQGNPVKRPPVKVLEGGWGFGGSDRDTATEAQSKMNASAENVEAKSSLDGGNARPTRKNHFDNDDTEILIIPDLEDDGEENVVTKVAVAPKNTSRHVPSLRELDEELKYSVPSTADGLDMGLLTDTLVPPEMLDEDDSVWDFDGLLQAVTQEFNAQAMADSGNSALTAARELPLPAGSRSALGSRVGRALAA